MMRIALLLGSLQTGGAERQFGLLAQGLVQAGHQVSFLTMTEGGALADAVESTRDIERVVLAPGLRGWKAILKSKAALSTWAEQRRADVLYSALYHTNWIAARPAVSRKLPVVWGVRTATTDWTRQQRLFLSLGKRHRHRVAAAISNSSAGVKAHQSVGYLPEQVHVVPNAVDLERFAPNAEARSQTREKWSLESKAKVVGFVGRPVPVKGLDLFLRLAKHSHESGLELIFVAVVPDPSKLDPSLREQLVQAEVLCVEGREVEKIYPALDVLASTSRAEGFPNTIAEAMASGVPAVSHDVGDCAALIGDTGRVVAVGDSEAMLESIQGILQGSEQAFTLRERVTEQCSPAALVERTVAVLESAKEAGGTRG